MERMTETADDGINIIRCTDDRYVGVSYIGYPNGVYFGNVIDRLAAYEDTELTPEEINDTLSRFSKFLMKMTENRMSKTNYTLDAMTSVALDYQEEVCDECEYKNGWISVKDRLPKPYRKIWVTDGVIVTWGIFLGESNLGKLCWRSDIDSTAISHWCELPAPPDDCKGG